MRAAGLAGIGGTQRAPLHGAPVAPLNSNSYSMCTNNNSREGGAGMMGRQLQGSGNDRACRKMEGKPVLGRA